MFKALTSLLKHSVVYGIGTIISPIVSFIMLPIYTRYLTPEDYGILALTGVVSVFFVSVLGMGISSGLVRIYYTYKTPEERNSVIYSSMSFSVTVSLIISTILLVFAEPVSSVIFNFPKGELYFRLVVVTYIFGNTLAKLNSILRVEEKSKLYSFFSVFILALTLGLNILFVVGFERGVQGVLEAGLIANAVNVFALLPFTLRGKKYIFSKQKLMEVLAFGLPLIPGGAADLILNLSDRYFLEYYVSTEEVGLYSVGYRIAAMLSILITKPFKIAWPPYMFSIADRSDAKDIYKKVLVYYVFVSAFFGLGLILFSSEVLQIIATEAYLSASDIVPFIVVTFILFGMMHILVAGIHIMKKTKYVSILFVGAALVNLLLNYLLIPTFKMYGAAVATLISYLLLNISYFVFSQKLYPIEHEFGRIFKIVFVFILIWVVGIYAIQIDNVFLSIGVKCLLILSFPVILYLMNFFEKEEIAKIFDLFNRKVLKKVGHEGV